MTPLAPDLADAVAGLAGCRRLLVALDFDGTLAPLADDRMTARATPANAAAVAAVAARPGVVLALVSGRDLGELVEVAQAPAGTTFVGSHGGQWLRPGRDGVETEPLAQGAEDELQAARAELARVAESVPRALLEDKFATVVLHTRRCEPGDAAALSRAAAAVPQRLGLTQVRVMVGRDVVELAVRDPDKGAAVRRLAAEVGADGVLFVGDDVTDESVFRAYPPRADARTAEVPSLMVKVGPEPTAASHRLAELDGVAALLEAVAASPRPAGG